MSSPSVGKMPTSAANVAPLIVLLPQANAGLRQMKPQTFDRFLQSAARNAAPADKKPQAREQHSAATATAAKTPPKAEVAHDKKPKDKTEKNDKPAGNDGPADPARKAAENPPGKASAAMAAAGEQALFELDLQAAAGPKEKPAAPAAQIIETETAGTDAAQAAPAEPEAAAVAADFTQQLKQTKAANAQAKLAPQVTDEDAPHATATDDKPASGELKTTAERGAKDEQLAKADADQPELTVKRELAQSAPPPAPAPDSPTTGQQNTISLSPGDQMRVQMRTASAIVSAWPSMYSDKAACCSYSFPRL